MRSGKSTWCLTWPRLNISTVLYPVGKSRVFDRGMTKSMHCIDPVREGESRVFDMGLTKSVSCIVASENREVDGVRRGSD